MSNTSDMPLSASVSPAEGWGRGAASSGGRCKGNALGGRQRGEVLARGFFRTCSMSQIHNKEKYHE